MSEGHSTHERLGVGTDCLSRRGAGYSFEPSLRGERIVCSPDDLIRVVETFLLGIEVRARVEIKFDLVDWKFIWSEVSFASTNF